MTERFPSRENFGLSSQMQRAAVSIPSNIAEGYARNTTKDYMRFVSMACGSLAELETQLFIAGDNGYVRESDVLALSENILELERMLKSLYSALQRKMESVTT